MDLGDRVLDVRMGRFFNCDPDEQKYPFQSTYTVATNNPVHIIDVDGRGPTSTHLDQAGKVIAVYNDGDLNVYKHQTAKNQEDVDKWRLKFNNKSGNGIKIGRTLIWNSFYDDATETYRGSISDVNKTSGWAFMISAWDDIKNTSSDDLLRRTYYAFNAHEYDKYDFKNKGKNKSTPENELLENRYRGSVLMYDGTTPIYASARDVGNYFAGVVASRTHEKKIEFLQIAGAFNYHNQNIKKVINSIAIDFKDVPIKFPTYGEDFRSDYFHRVGYHEIIGVDQLKKLGSKLWIE